MTDSAPRLPWHRALVVGLGQSGLSAARLLSLGGVEVRGYDRSATIDDLPDGVVGFLGAPEPPDEAFDGIDLLVLSPGVPPDSVLARQRTLAAQATVHGELGLALSLVFDPRYPTWRPLPTVLITGTNGKSTVTALTHALLAAEDRATFAGGNLGVPLSTLLVDAALGREPWPDTLVLECSSYQLETLPPLPTRVAMVLNVTPDHLDRYPSVAAYARTKARIFAGLDRDGLAILDAADPWTEQIAPRSGPARVALVGEAGGAAVEGDGVDRMLVLGSGERYPRDLLELAGRHNGKNALFALLAARHLGVSPEACRSGLQSYQGLPHRMALVDEVDGVAYYNDSKATNVAAVLASLDGFARPFVLIAGGRAKGDDLGQLRPLLEHNGRALVAVGEAAAALEHAIAGAVPTERAPSIEAAVHQARRLARPGDAVVLSPACASFDQFSSYAERGQSFARAVAKLSEIK